MDDDIPDDDPAIVEGMMRLAELRALEHTVSDLTTYNRDKPPASSRT